MGPEPTDPGEESDSEITHRATREVGEANEQERVDMILNGNFRVAGHIPVFTTAARTDTATVCTTLDYKLVSDQGKSTRVRAYELAGIAKSLLEQYVAMHQVSKDTSEVTVRGRTGGTANRLRKGLPTTRHDVEFDIEFEAVNPEVDEIVSGGHRAAYAVVSQGTGIVRLHHPDGRAAGEIRKEVFESLRGRFNNTTAEVKTELRTRSFVVELIALVKRHSGKSGTGKEKWFRNHWTVPPALMASVHGAVEVDTEIFASPLNVHPGTKVYGSAFDRDRLFGSVGSAWSRGWANPAEGSRLSLTRNMSQRT